MKKDHQSKFYLIKTVEISYYGKLFIFLVIVFLHKIQNELIFYKQKLDIQYTYIYIDTYLIHLTILHTVFLRSAFAKTPIVQLLLWHVDNNQHGC